MRCRPGVALLMMLAVLLLVSAAMLSTGAAGREYRQIARNAWASRTAQHAATAGEIAAEVELRHWLRDNEASPGSAGEALPMQFSVAAAEAASATVWLSDAESMRDVNRLGEDELHTLLMAAGIADPGADSLSQAIADWRDADDLRRARGAEASEYAARAHTPLPANRPYQQIGELATVLGMTAERFSILAPHLTVKNAGRTNINTAGLPVLVTLPGISLEAATVIVAGRASRRGWPDVHSFRPLLSAGARALLDDSVGVLLQSVSYDVQRVEGRVTACTSTPVSCARVEVVWRIAGAEPVVLERRHE